MNTDEILAAIFFLSAFIFYIMGAPNMGHFFMFLVVLASIK